MYSGSGTDLECFRFKLWGSTPTRSSSVRFSMRLSPVIGPLLSTGSLGLKVGASFVGLFAAVFLLFTVSWVTSGFSSLLGVSGDSLLSSVALFIGVSVMLVC